MLKWIEDQRTLYERAHLIMLFLLDFSVMYWNFCLLIFYLFFNFLSADCGHNSTFVTAFTECSSLVSRKSFGFITITWLILWKPTGQFVVLVAVSQLFTSMYSQRCQPLEILNLETLSLVECQQTPTPQINPVPKFWQSYTVGMA